MGKKGGKSGGGDQGIAVNKTAKFSVFDAPGVTQPDWSKEAVSKQNKDGAQGRRAKASTGPRMEEGAGKLIGGDSFVKRTANPEWLKTRVSVYEKIKERRQEELSAKKAVDISVTMPDGKVLKESKDGTPFQAWKTTPYDVGVAISQGLADAVSVARVTYESFVEDYNPTEDGMEGEDTLMDAMADGGVEQDSASEKTFLWDLQRPLVGPVSKLELLKFEDDKDAKTVFWHSSAHMMGEALEHTFGSKLTIGPPLAGGFYYDSYMGSDALREEDCTCGIVLNFFVCTRHLISIIIIEPKTSPWRRKSTKSSSRSKSLNEWSLRRRRALNCSLTILSKWKFCRQKWLMVLVPQSTSVET